MWLPLLLVVAAVAWRDVTAARARRVPVDRAGLDALARVNGDAA